MAETRVVNVTDLIDERPVSALQIGVFVLCGLVNLLDGMDSQSIGVAAPLIAQALDLKMTALGPVFSAALLGAAIGAFTFGPIADRVGRKRMLAVAAMTFGAFTLLTAHAGDYNTLLLYRLLAGIGLGGATPCFLSLTSEYAPKRLRATWVGALWAFFPLGGMLGGFVNAWVLHNFGWHTVFWVGGTLPFLVAAAVFLLMPESVRFLMTRDAPDRLIGPIVARMFPDAAPPGARFVAREAHLGGITVAQLFRDGRAIPTVLLWVPAFVGFGALAVAVLWLPSLMNRAGVSPSATAVVVGITGLGGLIGNGLSGKLLDKFGILAVSVPALLIGGASLAAFGFFAADVVPAAFFGLLTNGLIGLGVTSGIVLASSIYPVAVRSTGIGWTMGAGRSGQVVAPLVVSMTMGWGWNATQMMTLIASGCALGALCMVILHFHMGGTPLRDQTAPA